MLERKLKVAVELFENLHISQDEHLADLKILMSSSCTESDLTRIIKATDTCCGNENNYIIEKIKGKSSSNHISKGNGPLSEGDSKIFTCKIKGHEAIEISLPIDWSAFENIDKDRYWKIQFFSLSWLRALEKSNPYAIPVIAIEYCKSFFALETPAPFTWDEHCLADRIEVLAWVISLEQKGSIFISDQDFILIIRLLLIHSILILDDRFYAPNHNHGFMQDVSLIKVCSKFSSLNFFAQAKIKAENRLLEMQISKSLTKDGAHKENSPGYHLHFLKLLTRLEKIPELSANFQQQISDVKNLALETFSFFLQPDMTAAAFGDTARSDLSDRLFEYSASIKNDHSLTAQKYQCILRKGSLPQANAPTDAIYRSTGYVSFRNRWDFSNNHSRAVGNNCLFAKCGYQSTIHKHDDDGGFILFGAGRELISDPGKFSNDKRKYSEASIGAKAQSHSVFRFKSDGRIKERLKANIERNFSSNESCSFAIGHFPPHAETRRPRVYRIFVFIKPRDVIIVDIFRSRKNGRPCVSQVCLHPDFQPIEPRNAESLSFNLRFNDGTGLDLRPLPVSGATSFNIQDFDYRWSEGLYFPAELSSCTRPILKFHHEAQRGVNALAYVASVIEGEQANSDFRISFNMGCLEILWPKGFINIPLDSL